MTDYIARPYDTPEDLEYQAAHIDEFLAHMPAPARMLGVAALTSAASMMRERGFQYFGDWKSQVLFEKEARELG